MKQDTVMNADEPRLIEGGIAVDDRGCIRFVNDFTFANVVRFYQVQNHNAGFIRAWHGHRKEAKYVYVPKGSAVVKLVSMEEADKLKAGTISRSELKIHSFVLSDKKPQVLYVPESYYNGFMTLEEGTILVLQWIYDS